MKEKIIEAIQSGQCEQAAACLEQYKAVQPNDFEIFSLDISICLMKEEYDQALCISGEAVTTNPFEIEANYNHAYCLELNDYVLEAYDYYSRVMFLEEYYHMFPLDKEELRGKLAALSEWIRKTEGEDKLVSLSLAYQYMTHDPFKHNDGELIGEVITDFWGQRYYVGRENGWFESLYAPERNRDAHTTKCEMFPIEDEGTDYRLDVPGKDMLVPVVIDRDLQCESANTMFETKTSNKKYYLPMATGKYCYLPVKDRAHFLTRLPAIFGKPIPLREKADETRKKLVLNIFLDSLNYKAVKGEKLKDLMPNTYRFFEKGMICEQYYSCSEYTNPSMATYWTGRYPSQHMNLDEMFRWNFMGSGKVLTDYFKDAGYVTARISGNDSATPLQGYIKNMDRFVFQDSPQGLTVKEIVGDAVEHLDAFHETSQFLWLDIQDLHQVSSGFVRSLDVQAGVPFAKRIADNTIKSTIQQSYSPNRSCIFEQELRHIDLYLGLLYHYIETHYTEDEILVSLFSDHGTAFLVSDDQPFMSHERTNIPLLIRTAGVSSGYCDEVMQTTDYAGIICKLAGLPYDYEGTDAALPHVFGGGQEREFAFTQSLFVGDPYQAAFHGRDFHVYYKTEQAMEKAFRVDVGKRQIWAVDDKGRNISAHVDLKRYEEYLLERIGHLIRYL